MKTYVIPVTHTATAVVEHVVKAKNMQDAMFQLGQSLPTAPDPFDCLTGLDDREDSVVEFGVEVSAGSPAIIADTAASS